MLATRLHKYIGLALILLVMAGCSGLAGEPQIIATMRPQPTPQPVSLPEATPDYALGAQIFAANCTRCHGTTGKGDGDMVQSGQVQAPPDFTNPETARNATPLQWLTIVTNGQLDKLMPPWADKLSEAERWSVTMYIYTLANPSSVPLEVAAAQPAATENAPVTAPNSTAEAAAQVTAASPNSTPEVASVTGSISGTVVNKTAGGSVPPDLTINLHIISTQDAQDPGTIQQATVNADGTYRFDNVPISANSQYIVTTSYHDAVFSSEVAQGDPANTQIDLPLSIYEVTNDASKIEIDGMLVMLQNGNPSNQLQVVQIVSFNNTSDQVYMQTSGDTSTSVSVSLPPGATFQDFSGGSYVISADGTKVSDTTPVLPGSSHVMHVAFNVPYSGSVSIAQPLEYALNGQVEVMAQSGGMSITGSNMSTLGTRQLGDHTFTSYGGTLTQAAGASFNYGVSGTDPADTTTSPSTTTPANGINPLAYVLIAAGLLSIGAAFGFFMRERTSAPRTGSPAAPVSSADANRLMKQIADLDVRFHNGKLTEARYRQQRSTLKAQLMALMKDQADSSPSTEQSGD
jgi:mono/diheme cytochrome c family protein